MGGRLGHDVAEGEAEFIFVDDVDGDFFTENFAEKGWVGFGADVGEKHRILNGEL